MKEFSCGDVVPGCSMKFRARSEVELLGQVAEHARKDHGLKEIPDELVRKVKQHIHNVEHG